MTATPERKLESVPSPLPKIKVGDTIKFSFKQQIILPFTGLPLKISPWCEVLEIHEDHYLVNIDRILGIYEYDPKKQELYDLENPYVVIKERVIDVSGR